MGFIIQVDNKLNIEELREFLFESDWIEDEKDIEGEWLFKSPIYSTKVYKINKRLRKQLEKSYFQETGYKLHSEEITTFSFTISIGIDDEDNFDKFILKFDEISFEVSVDLYVKGFKENNNVNVNPYHFIELLYKEYLVIQN